MKYDTTYLANYPKSTHGGETKPTRVLHMGLTNVPELKIRLYELITRANEIASNNTSHLSDIAFQINFVADKLKELSADTFEAHEIEKTF